MDAALYSITAAVIMKAVKLPLPFELPPLFPPDLEGLPLLLFLQSL
jgi:hypothetical protein